MASFNITFQANTTGDHTVAYRIYNNDAPGTSIASFNYDTLTVSVTVPGTQVVNITVPANLYCVPVTYTGYVIADCLDQTDGTGDGIPDAASTFTVTLDQQVDPCIFHEITCAQVPIDTLTLVSGGSGYAGTETIVIDAPTAPGGVQATATPTFGTGSVTGMSRSGGGTGYLGAGPYTVTPVLTTGGYPPTTGTGLTIDVVITAGIVTSAIINTPGNADFVAADSQLTINPADVGGIGLGSECLLVISPTAGWKDELYSINLTDPGSGYEGVPSVVMNPESGDPAIFLAPVMGTQPLDLSAYNCATVDGNNDTYNIELGDAVSICASRASILGISSVFDAVEIEQCHCKECIRYFVSNPTGSPLKATIQTCWDGTDGANPIQTITVTIPAATVDQELGCGILDSIVLEDPINMTITTAACII